MTIKTKKGKQTFEKEIRDRRVEVCHIFRSVVSCLFLLIVAFMPFCSGFGN